MMTGVLIWAGVRTALTAVCLTRPQLGRSLIGLFFLAMAIGINLNLVMNDPQRFVTFAEGAYLPFYRDVALRVVSPAPALFGLAVAAYEIGVALLVLQRGKAVRIGLVGVILFLLWIIPLGKEEIPNLILIVGVAYLLKHRFETSSFGPVRAAFRRRTSAVGSTGQHPIEHRAPR